MNKIIDTIFWLIIIKIVFQQLGDFYVEINWDFQSWGKFLIFHFSHYNIVHNY